MLGRSDGLGPRRSTVSSEFPSGIDRVATNFKQERATPLPNKSEDRSVAKARAVNQQMGELMAKCISMLENEIFAPLPQAKTTHVEDSLVPDADIEVSSLKEYEGSESSSIVEEKSSDHKKLETTNIPAQNEATMIMALAGLKHVRDVLLGKQQHFDASVMDPKFNLSDTSEEWDIVDPKEASLNSPAMDDPQPTKTPIFIPQTSASIISNDMDSSYVKDKPLPPIVEPIKVAEPKLPPVTYIPTNPTPPKQSIKYRIEDLLSDPDLQLTSPKASNNVKFKWMLSNENEDQNEVNANSSNDLFKSEQAPRMSPRKRSSFIINKSKPIEAGEAVDPLDAKNVDNRRDYEFDMF